jgi:hypothetical protein
MLPYAVWCVPAPLEGGVCIWTDRQWIVGFGSWKYSSHVTIWQFRENVVFQWWIKLWWAIFQAGFQLKAVFARCHNRYLFSRRDSAIHSMQSALSLCGRALDEQLMNSQALIPPFCWHLWATYAPTVRATSSEVGLEWIASLRVKDQAYTSGFFIISSHKLQLRYNCNCEYLMPLVSATIWYLLCECIHSILRTF